MKTTALFLLLVGVLTASAKTLTDENGQGDIEEVDITDKYLDGLKSTIKERNVAGDDNVDLESLKSEVDERELTEDVDAAAAADDDDANLESFKSAIEERRLTKDVAHPVDVSRRYLRCGGSRCELCIGKVWFRGCIGARAVTGGISVYVRIGWRTIWRKTLNVRRTYRIKIGSVYVYITNLDPRNRSLCLQVVYHRRIKYRWWGKTKYKTIRFKIPRSPWCRTLRFTG